MAGGYDTTSIAPPPAFPPLDTGVTPRRRTGRTTTAPPPAAVPGAVLPGAVLPGTAAPSRSARPPRDTTVFYRRPPVRDSLRTPRDSTLPPAR
jgi:hypothetical protein